MRISDWSSDVCSSDLRRALPAPERGRPELAVAYEPAVDELEQALCQAFAELLDIDRAGRHDNFFELGGSSLLAMKLAERIRGLPGTGGAVATTVIFGPPTPALLAPELRGTSDCPIDPTRISRFTDPGAGRAYDTCATAALAGPYPRPPPQH